ncbi:obscurin-like protein 1 isoform X2 [Carcharodon carcharias]|uniref:obscurin-like protein 1 isoform X2 n=1 Tax=Carcharodon carcharias TaxID=13397 RepID=UPI001B7E9D67|nr:obscurin-like protein 1 isoform X2 [Carcharodon carcharias]
MDVFGGAPRFLSYPRTFTVPNGADAILKCQIAGDPRPTVIWERDKTQIFPSGRYHFLEDGNIYNLVVSQARLEDSGQYICKAKNGVGETYAAATLKVEEWGVSSENKPAFLVKPTSARVARGDNVVFSGQLTGCPMPVVTWEKDGKKLGEIFESGHFSEGWDGEGWHHLKIFNARIPDAGVYLCKARSAFGEAMSAAVLLVDPGAHTQEAGPPTEPAAGYPSTNGIQDGEGPDSRRCLHEARRERRHRSRHRNLRDPQPASRSARQSQISEEGPRVSKVKVFSVTEGKHAKFRCYVTGKPKPEIIWRKDGRLIAPGRRHLLYEDREGYFILKVLYCKQQDNGLYACAASNAAGQTLSSVLLHVKEPHIKFKSQLQDVEVNEREQAILECEVPGDSIPAVWYLEDRKLHSSAKYIIEQQGSLRRLTIKDITMDDDGVYLCEMKDGGRSIAEVAVKGKIVKRLPRKLDVVEGENAAFCVDLDEENVEVSWYKDGELLSESHKTIIKSFGKTHILVFVNATAEDSGVVTFVISDSKSSSQLRVKAKRQVPPSAPVNVRMSSEKPNIASLLWSPPSDCQRNRVSAYVIERQELGSEEWVRCLTAETSTAVEILGDSVPTEARYRFRVCSINNYGRSEQVEFPGAVHLVPSARIHTHLSDLIACQDTDAEFTIELSTSVLGIWHMKGRQLHDDERFKIEQSRSRHSLLIRGVKMEENESEITFVAHGVRDSAILFVKAVPVRITTSPGMDRVQQVTASESIVLCCELSRPNVQVRWCKDGEELIPSDRLTIQSLGQVRKLIVQSAQPSDSGQYACDAADDVIVFSVKVSESPVRIVNGTDDTKMEYLTSDRIALTCELSHSNAEVKWYKDGLEVEGSGNVTMESHGVHRSLIIQKAGTEDSGEYVCDAGDDSIFYDITVKEPPVKIVNSSPPVLSVLTGGKITLLCELSRPEAEVRWYKDGVEVKNVRAKMEVDRGCRRLTVCSATMEDQGMYVCDAFDDSAKFEVTVSEPPVKIVNSSSPVLSVLTGGEVVLMCELSRSEAEVRWYKDGVEVKNERAKMEVDREHRRLTVCSATMEDQGTYVCDAVDDSAKFEVTVSEPPVKVINSSPSVLSVLTGGEIVLSCELSRPEVEVTWYKDGVEVERSKRSIMEVDRDCRRLTVRSATMEDRGTYWCDAVDDLAKFEVTVSEPPVKIVNCSPLVLSVLTGGEVVLSCEVSRPEAEVRWYKDGLEVERSERSVVEVDRRCRRLTIHSATMEDQGTYTCDAVDDSAKFEVTVSEPPVKIIRRADQPAEHKYSASEDIALECELSRLDGVAKWYKDGEKLVENERISIGRKGTFRSLRILDARTTDSGEYLCDVQGDSVVFRVCVEEPPVKIIRQADQPAEHKYSASEDIALECELSRLDGVAKWYKDGEKLVENERISIGREGTFRSLRILDVRTTDSGEYLCDVQGDSVVFRVCVEELPVKIIRQADQPAEHKYSASEDIALECELSRLDGVAKWYKDGEKLVENERISIGREGTFRSLRILDARTTDSGEYLCDVQGDGVVFRVCVEDPPVTIVGSSQISGDRSFTESETIAMTCELSRPDVQVQWYRDGTELLPADRIRIDSRGLTRELMIFDSEPGDSGHYVCDAGSDKLTFKVTVTEAPLLFTNKEKHPEEVHANENGKAVLAAIVSKEHASVTWFRHKEQVLEGEKYEMKSESRVHSLIIKNVLKEDSGFYTCRSADDEMVFNVTMAELPLQFVLKLEDLCVQKDGTVTLWCELNKAKGDVMWLKDGKEVQPNRKHIVRAEGRLRSLTLAKVTLADQGEYSCESKDDRTSAQVSVRVPRVVEFICDLRSVTVLEGDDANFKCMVSPEDVRLSWQVNGTEIPPGSDRYVASRNGLCHTLVIRNCQLAEATRVTAEAEGIVSSATLQVQETQIVFTRKMESVVTEELQDAAFEVEVSSESAEVQWMKQGVVIQPGPKFLLQQDGRTRRLVVCSTVFADRGSYRCETLHDRTQAKLSVEPRRITVRKPLEDLEIFEKEAVTFQVELSHPDVAGVWIKDGIRVKSNNNRRISVAGRVHSLTLSALTLEDSGTISFQADNVRSSSRLTVREPPVTFLKQLKDLRVPETTFITMECELSRPNVEVTWYKNDLEMKPNKNIRIYSMGRKRIAHLGKCGVQDSGTYTCDTGESKTSCQLEVYEREIQIVKELEDLEVRENDNAVFVCEVSHEEVKSEWLKNGDKIKSNSSVKIRQEGTKHFLLICKVRAEDAGEIRFTAKNVESVARLDVNELPIKIVKPLRDKTALEKHKVILECKVSKPRARVRWYRGSEELHPTGKYEICSEDCYRQLVIHDVSFQDEDTYTCDAFDDCSSAKVLVEEQAIRMVKELVDVEVMAPQGVQLECEVSVPVIRPPQWSLNGQLLQNGNGVHVENKGTIQRLILSQTSPDMSGTVKFTAGKARSSAQLTVNAE